MVFLIFILIIDILFIGWSLNMIKKNLKKNKLIDGAFIVTISIIITKILGILYVIPFYSIIGEKGGALYSYAYTIYTFFMSIAVSGIPLAISKLVSEYQTLGYYRSKVQVFRIAKILSFTLGFFIFLLLYFLSPVISKMIIGKAGGGNSLNDIVWSIRIISFAIIIVPLLSVYRGYFEGHRFMNPPSISQVLEQLFRVMIILLGCFLSIKILPLKFSNLVYISLVAVSIGAIVSYLYLVYQMKKNSRKFHEKIRDVGEPIISNTIMLKKILVYSIPFIMIDFFKGTFNYIDMFTVIKGLSKYFSSADAEIIFSIMSTWASKFHMVLLAFTSGICLSLIPNLTESIVKKNNKSIQNNINQSFSILAFIIFPMTMGISFLAKPIWFLFYGNSNYGPSILSYSIFIGLFFSFFYLIMNILQVYKGFRYIFICLISGIIFKLLFNTRLMISFSSVHLAPYHGAITASIIGFIICISIGMIILRKNYSVLFDNILKNIVDILCGSIFMIFGLCILKLFIPISSSIRIYNLFIIIFYGSFGALLYFLYGKYTNLISSIFGNKVYQVIKKSFIRS